MSNMQTDTHMHADLEIARSAKLKPIGEIASLLGLEEEEIIAYGPHKAKIRLSVLERVGDRSNGRYIDVTAITPTPLGEGKTTTAIGLTDALGVQLGKRAVCCLRQPSLGPTFNIKGGAAGGGYSQVIPMEDFNLHLTGDIHAVGAAHNLVAAAIDGRMFHESRQSDKELLSHGISRRLDIDPEKIIWNRVVDICDRSLREIETGLNDTCLKDGSPSPVFPRRSGFDITAASELMAILSLAVNLKDLRQRISRVVVASDMKGKPVSLEDLGAAGAVTVLLKDALMPNLMQTMEGQPVFVHCGPFANIAHGNSSILADKIALKLADYVVTESGFGADIGMEKFFNIKCRYSGLTPDAVVLVVTVRALKLHGGDSVNNRNSLRKGLGNMGVHIDNIKKFGIPVVVAVNHFLDDSESDLDMIRGYALKKGVEAAVTSRHWSEGSKGAEELAGAVVSACEKTADFKFLYPLGWPIKKKIETIAREIYGASAVSYTALADEQIARHEGAGYGNLPICMAKTPYSLSHDPEMRGVPDNFILPVREVRASIGAGFIYPLIGKVCAMPGLATHPAFMDIDLDPETGETRGLF